MSKSDNDEVRLLTPTEKAKQLRVSTETLRHWRTLGIGPQYVIYANTVRYFPEEREGGAA